MKWKYCEKYKRHVSNTGLVKGKKGKILKPYINNKATKYYAVKINKKNRYIHDLVLLTFKGEKPKGSVVRHLDGNPQNNNLSNLAYGTPRENWQDAVKHKTYSPPPIFKGEKHPQSKLTREQVENIRKEYKKGEITQKKIADKYGIKQPQVSEIILYRAWA